MSHPLTPSKRPLDLNPSESNGKKFQKTTSPDSPKQMRKASAGSAVFRLLCPSSKIEFVTGTGDDVISDIRQETGAKVRVDDPVAGCDERVIFIMGADKDAINRNDNEDDKLPDEQVNSEDHKNTAPNNGIDSTPEDSESERVASSVQRALLLVFEKFIEAESEMTGDAEEKNPRGTTILRLLVLTSQVGCLLGRGGSIIKQMSVESGAQIRVLPRDKLSPCASSTDDVVQIAGDPEAVKRAIKSISEKIMGNPPRDQDTFPSHPSKTPPHLHSPLVPKPEVNFNRSLPSHGAPFASGFCDNVDLRSGIPSPFPKFRESFMPSRMDLSDIFTFRLLCPDERVGGVIGKGGAIIKTLQHETGCEINVVDGTSDGEERIIVISGRAHPDDRISAIQDAVLRVQNRIAKALPDKEKGATAKLLISSNQVGFLLGKGGSVIAEMRKVTGAYIRVLGKDQIPKCASENEVVQINGEPEVVQEAVLQITTRLLHFYFREAFRSVNHSPNLAFLDRGAPLPSYLGRRDLSPPRVFPKFGPSFRSFDFVDIPPPHGGFPRNNPSLMHDMHRPEVSHLPDRPWHPQAFVEGSQMGLSDYPGAAQGRISRLLGGSQHAVITNTIVEVVVPSSLVPAIYGDGGGCLRQIRQISDAKITVCDPKPGAAQTVITISGMPEETHAAQSLIQAFVMMENESS